MDLEHFRHVFVNLYKIYVRPHLEFCTSAWSPWTEADLNTLEQVQKRAIRMISGLHSESYEEKLKELNMLSHEERRERADMILTFKILQGFNDVNPGTWFSRINHSQVTRNATDSLNLEIQIYRTNVRSNFYSVRVNQKMELNSIRHQRIFYLKRKYDEYRMNL